MTTDTDGPIVESDTWFRMYRKITDSPIFADAELLKLWVWILSKAATKQRHLTLGTGGGTKIITLLPGQCIVGRMKSAAELDWKPSTFRNRLSRLEAMGMVSIKADTHWSVISVTNWLRFQRSKVNDRTGRGQAEDKLRTGRGQAEDKLRTGRGQAEDTNKNDRKIELENDRKIDSKATNVAECNSDLLDWIHWWNSLKAKNLVAVGASPKPSKGLRSAWKRVQKSKELQALLSDRNALEAKIRDQAFLHEGTWFDLPKLLGGTNGDGEYIVQKITDGGYAGSSSSKPKSANVGPGVNYDAARSTTNEPTF